MLRDQMMANNSMSRWPVTVSLTAGFGAEAISCVMWVPIDVTKERLQVQSVLPKGSRRYTSSAHAFTTILQREGLGGLYRGYAATLQSFGPFSALYFATYEQSKAAVTVLHGGHLDRRCGTAAQPLRGAVSNVNLCAANHSADFAASCPCHTCWHVPRLLVLWQLGCSTNMCFCRAPFQHSSDRTSIRSIDHLETMVNLVRLYRPYRPVPVQTYPVSVQAC